MKRCDLGVRRGSLALIRVKADPQRGQYAYENGVYTFNKKDARRTMVICEQQESALCVAHKKGQHIRQVNVPAVKASTHEFGCGPTSIPPRPFKRRK